MSTFYEIITRVDERKPNAFSDRVKLSWLTALDGKIAADVFLMGIEEIRALPRKYPEAMDKEPLVGYPHDDLYDAYLEAKIDYANGDYSEYQNCMESYNQLYSGFRIWFANLYDPVHGGRKDCPSYYITAYGLAVQAGFTGTMENWLESLNGPKGDPGKSAYEYAQEAGYIGTEESFGIHMLKEGKSAYIYACEGGYTGTEQEFTKKLAAEYAPLQHNHDGSYAAGNHNHDNSYAAKNHDHDYAESGHNHDDSYAEKNHEHNYAAGTHKHKAGDIETGCIPLERGGTGTSVDMGKAPAHALIKKAGPGFDQLYYMATNKGALYATEENGAPKFGTLPLTLGGTGSSVDLDSAPANAIIRKLADDKYNQLYYTRTGNGAFYATQEDGIPKFGTLPIAQGGTGATTADGARNNLGVKYKIYNSLADLGLSNGVTTAEVFEAMPTLSILVCASYASANYISDVPVPYSHVELIKTNTYGSARLIRINSTTPSLYEGAWYSISGFSGWYSKMINVLDSNWYGETLPTNPVVGQLYFLDADKADELGL